MEPKDNVEGGGESLYEFLTSRGFEEKKIQEIKEQKIDWETILVMSDADLGHVFPTYGDKLAVISYAKQQERKKQVNARKRTLFEKLSHKFSSKKNQPEENGKKKYHNAVKPTRKIEIGWIDYNHSKKEYNQVRTKCGGGVRKISVNKDAKSVDIMREAKTLFFPNGASSKGKEEEFSFQVMNYQLVEMDNISTVGDVYKCTKFSVLRFYLASRKTRVDCHAESDESDSELPVFNLGDEACTDDETSNGCEFQPTNEFPSISGEAACSLPLASTPTPSSQKSSSEEVIYLTSDDLEVQFGPFISDEDIGELTLPLLTESASNVASEDEGHLNPSVPLVSEPSTSEPIVIKRANILNDMIDAFRHITKESVQKKTSYNFRIKHPNGKMEAGEGVGVTRDCISSFWEEFYSRCTVGCSIKVPFIRHDFGASEWMSVAKIIVYGWNICEYFPCHLSVSFMEIAISGKSQSGNLLEDFLHYLSDEEATVLKSAVKHFDSYPTEDITDVLDTYGCRTIPNKDNLETLLSEIAHKEIIQAPAFVSECWSQVLDVLDKSFTITQVIQKLTPTNRKVSKLFTFNDMLSALQDTTKNHLLKFIRELDTVMLKRFLRFCTGSDLLTCEVISVQFNNRGGLSRHPVAHTCGCVLELPVTYDNYPEFRSEFNAVLESGVWVMDIS